MCPDHLPSNFTQDPLSSIWLPSNCISIIYLLMQQETSIKSCIETVKEIENEAVSAIASLHNELDMLYKKANEVKDSILKCCALNNNSTIFFR